MNPSNSPNYSLQHPPLSPDSRAVVEALLMLKRDVEMEERSDSDEEASIEARKRRWAEEQEAIEDQRRREEAARRQKEAYYEAARRFAFSMHSRFSLDNVHKQDNKDDEEQVRKEEDKSDFQKAKEAIKKRSKYISHMEIDLLMIPRKAPTLMDLTARVLAQNCEAIKSLSLVPDHLRKRLSNLVSGLGRVDTRFMQLLIADSPDEISARNCVDLEEDDLVNILCDCDRLSLKVLILDLCGRSVTESSISRFLTRSPNGFPSLTNLSLQGAFCLTDSALERLAKSSPLLRFINLSDCSLITSYAVKVLAETFGRTLRGLNIGGCQRIKCCKAIYKFDKLSFLSVAGLESINDSVLRTFFMFCSSNLTDLSLASCNEVTDDCIWDIGRYCKKLEALDISDLDRLTDTSLEYISEGCKFLNAVKLSSNSRFSDEGVAAFLEVSGRSLNELCLNKVRDVGPDTAISLASVCRRLQFLDLSWCRRLTELDLRRILSCCSSLRALKLFGWTQVDDTFLKELSRSHVHIIGLKMTSLYAHLDDFYPAVGAKFF